MREYTLGYNRYSDKEDKFYCNKNLTIFLLFKIHFLVNHYFNNNNKATTNKKSILIQCYCYLYILIDGWLKYGFYNQNKMTKMNKKKVNLD